MGGGTTLKVSFITCLSTTGDVIGLLERTRCWAKAGAARSALQQRAVCAFTQVPTESTTKG